MDEAEQSLERSTKQHGFGRRKPEGFRVDVEVGVIGDGARAAVTLWDHAKRAKPEVGVVEQEPGW